MSQEIQLVNTNMPLQPALGPQPLAPAGAIEVSPFRKAHQLLRGRYGLAVVLALIGATLGAAAGILLPKPAFESVAIIQIQPVILKPGEEDKLMVMYQQYIANVMVELHTDRVIRQAMQSPEWRAHRPYAGDYPPPEEVTEFSRNLTIKPMPFAQEMIQVIYDDGKKDSKDVAQVAVKSIVGAFQSIWSDSEAQALDIKIQYQEKERNNLQLAVDADHRAIQELTKQVGDDEASMIQPRLTNLIQLEKNLKDAQQMLRSAELDRDRRRVGLNGAQPYSADEIARVDGTMLARLTALNEARLSYEELLSEYGPAYPRVIETKRLVDLRQEDIDEAARKFNDSYFIQQRADGGPGMSISKDLTKLQNVVSDLQTAYNAEDERIKDVLGRHAQIVQYKDDIARKNADLVSCDKLLETFAFEKSMGGTFKVVDEGSVPTPAGDRRPVFAAMGMLGGAALPIGCLMLLGLANPRYRFSDEAGEDMNGMNLLGILPDLPDRLSDPEQASIAAHCVHQIRTMLQISGAPEERRVFAITSAAPGDGKTSLTLALGLSYAACGARTLLIDCDLVGAGLTSRMNVNSPAGVLEAIANRSLFEYVRTTEVADVTILPVGSAQTLHASTLSPAALRRLIDEARKQYDTILVDTGPILGSIEASLVCAAADAVVLTVARGQQRPLVEKAIARLTGISAKLAGVVFNRAQSGDFNRSISGASSLRSASAGSGHNGNGNGNGKSGPRYGALGRAVHSHHTGRSDLNAG